MGIRFIARNRVRLVSGLVVVAAVGSVIAYALAAPGYAAHKADINDGGVWVTRGVTGQFGKLNKPINQLDGYAFTPGQAQSSYNIDVFQDGSAVLAQDAGNGLLYPIDVTTTAALTSAKVSVSGTNEVGMGGGTIAVLNSQNGAIRTARYDPEQPLTNISSLGSPRPLATVGGASALAVGDDGTVYAASADGGLTTIRRTPTGFSRPSHRALGSVTGSLQMTVVGADPIVIATPAGSTSSVAYLPGGTKATFNAGAGAVVQQSGPANDQVLVATDTKLVGIPLAGGSARTLFAGGSGTAAAPVRLRGCTFAAWSGPRGVFATSCGSGQIASAPINEPSTHLVFRINRGQLMLNDRDSGNTWNVDSGAPQQVANWKAITRPRTQTTSKTKNNHNDTRSARALPPKPQNDRDLGARPGRTTPLYVLDNDSDPSGEVLAVNSVDAAPTVLRMLSISPDGQTVDLNLPSRYTRPVFFRYTVRAAKGGTASADVNVNLRTATQNANPTLRKRFVQRTWTVPQSGTVTLPVLSDWRDYTDGDPIVLTGAKATGGTVTTTPDGELIYTAPAKSGPQSLSYSVSDGMGGTGTQTVPVTVQADNARPVAATAEPDYARGQVSKPITVLPLNNDLPGSDPLSPTATIRLAGDVSAPTGVTVTTDIASGALTVVSSRVGPVQLSYQVAFGNAAYAHGVIDIQVDPKSGPKPPVTAPDVAVLHGQAPVTVDVLANDADPAGNLLVVERAVPANPTDLQVAVIDGRYLRIFAQSPHLAPLVQSIEYTVSDGVTGEVGGSVTVTQLPTPSNDTPVTLADYATVRGGQSVTIPVLDNDSTPAGDPLTLAQDVLDAPRPGQFTVSPKVGNAFVSGKLVRYVAPVVGRTTSVTIAYVAQNAAGEQQTGQATVTVTAPVSKTNPNQTPIPPTVEGRAVAGQTVKVKIPTTGVDPDGDPVTVTAIGSAPVLGRVLAVNANSIEYQAYPNIGNGGTDSFNYVVSDTYGASQTGAVRVAVTAPGDPQPPVAVDDAVTAAPSAVVRLDVLANDLVAPDDRVTINALSRTDPSVRSEQVKLDGARRSIVVRAPSDTRQSVQFAYTITDGLNSSTATVTVRAQRGVNLPPVAYDQFATPRADATSVVVDLLRNDYDPDGSSVRLLSPAGAVNGAATIRLTHFPQVMPYVIEDAHGGRASALVYVPSSGAGVPRLKPGAAIALKSGAVKTINVADLVVNPSGKPVHTTTTDTIAASPAVGLTAAAPAGDATHLKLTAARKYDGPASVTFQVTDGKSATAPGANTAFITVPVQVGNIEPVLRCPSTVTDIVEGGQPSSVPVATYCHVWMPDPADAAKLTFVSTWQQHPSGVTLSGDGSSRVVIRASGSASRSTGQLKITAQKYPSASSTLSVQVVEAPKLTITPVTIDGVRAGQAKTVDLAQYLHSQLGDPHFAVVGTPIRTSGMPASISASGTRVTVNPGKDSKNTITFSFVATDVRDTSRANRHVTGEITLHVLGHPETPTNVQPARTVLSGAVSLTWTAPASNGAPIIKYLVKYEGGSHQCGASPACVITGLTNGRTYHFTVTAYNAVGASKPSAASAGARPDRVPDAVAGFAGSNPQDRTLTFTWRADGGAFSPVQYYLITWAGGSKQINGAGSTSTTIGGLDNNQAAYGFTIRAHNDKGFSSSATPASGITESAGRPATPTGVTVLYANSTGTDKRQVSISWTPVSELEGVGPAKYALTKSPGGPVAGCSSSATECSDSPPLGSSYVYSVTVQNHAADADPAPHTSYAGKSNSFEVASKPKRMDTPKVDPVQSGDPDGTLTVRYTTVASRGTSLSVHCAYTSDGSPPRADSTTCPTSPWHDYAPSGGTNDLKQLDNLGKGATVRFVVWEDNGSHAGNNADSTSGDISPRTLGDQTNGPPNPPTDRGCGARPQTSVTFNWSAGAPVGGRSIDHYTYTNADNGQTAGTSDTVDEPQDGNQSELDVTSFDSKGEPSTTVTQLYCSDASKPIVTVTPGDSATPKCSGTACHYINVSVSNLYPGEQVDLLYKDNCNSGCAGTGKSCPGHSLGTSYFACGEKTADPNGNAYESSKFYGYGGYTVTVDVFVVNSDSQLASGTSGAWPK